jgi:TPR repeat protein
MFDLMADNFSERINLEKLSFLIQTDDVKEYALVLAEFISSMSLDELKKRVIMSNAEATLKLGDCYMYGLKGLPRDQVKAKKLFKKAGDLGSGEACTQLALMCHWDIQHQSGIKDEETPIPAHLKTSIRKIKLEMWEHLEKAAKAGYVTLFMIKMDMNAQASASWYSSPNFKRTIEKRVKENADVPGMEKCMKSLIGLYSHARLKKSLDETKGKKLEPNAPHMRYDFYKLPILRYDYKCQEILVHEQFDFVGTMSEVKRILNIQEDPVIPKGTYYINPASRTNYFY